MTHVRAGEIVAWRSLSPILAIFRVLAEPGTQMPTFQAGQYIALTRRDCLLTRREWHPDGSYSYVPDIDASGTPRRGAVTHAYSIASAPFESLQGNYLEFYVVLERNPRGERGRFTESLFRIEQGGDRALAYFERIVGDFTFEKRARGFGGVLFVGTGSGLAPLVSIIKELWFERRPGRFTLLHVNRSHEELGYHQELLDIEASRRFDFLYVPSVSRPSAKTEADPKLGQGRANNLLRRLFGMPTQEEEALAEAQRTDDDLEPHERALELSVVPRWPRAIDAAALRQRLEGERTVVMTCGNPRLMADVKRIADRRKMRFEKEEW